VFIEAHAINYTGEIFVMGKAAPAVNASGGTVPEHQDCAPAPPSSFLLTPAASK